MRRAEKRKKDAVNGYEIGNWKLEVETGNWKLGS
jgi:hypothetical protein